MHEAIIARGSEMMAEGAIDAAIAASSQAAAQPVAAESSDTQLDCCLYLKSIRLKTTELQNGKVRFRIRLHLKVALKNLLPDGRCWNENYRIP